MTTSGFEGAQAQGQAKSYEYDKLDLLGQSVRGFKKEYFYLSNFFDAPIELDGIMYRNSEAAYQAGRCKTEAEKREFAELDAGVELQISNTA